MAYDYKDLWENMLSRLKTTIPHSQFITWFKQSAIIEIDKDLIVIGVTLPMAMKWINEHFRDDLLKTIQEFVPSVTSLNIQVDANLVNLDDPRHINQDIFHGNDPNKGRKKPREGQVLLGEGLTTKVFDNSYTLASYIVGSENRLAHAACSAVASAPGQNYNPLFIFGSTGLGKTHLLQGTGNEILKRHPNKLVVYTTSEAFGNDYIAALGKRKMDQFNNRYRKVDVLIIDDIQFLSGKNKTEEVFFHTFNALYDAGKQIIIASDRPPKELNELDKRLTGRFEMGMVCDVSQPEYETKMLILQEKVRKHKVIIDPKVLEFIAMNVHHSVRELEGILMQAIAESELEKSTPTVRSVEKILKKLNKHGDIVGGSEIEDETPKKLTGEDQLIDTVSQYFNVDSEKVVGPSRKQEIAFTRQVAMYIMKRELNFSLERIGKIFGGRNHTTAMHSINNIKSRITTDVGLQKDINALKKEMGMV
ncbi:MAG: chromosomal replication initiator protein DnaA [Candidatus Gracilibacteria bacterium]|nr:chromosomal replication initiator protein DnaA [Candidatus Gracilibacteria bacterium]